MFMQLVSGAIAAGVMIIAVLSIVAGVWLSVRPSYRTGVVAGSSCLLLGLADIGVASEVEGFGAAVVIDFIVAAGTLASATRYRRTSESCFRSERLSDVGGGDEP